MVTLADALSEESGESVALRLIRRTVYDGPASGGSIVPDMLA